MSRAAFDWLPRWKEARARLLNAKPPPPSPPKMRAYCPTQYGRTVGTANLWRKPQVTLLWQAPQVLEDDAAVVRHVLDELARDPPINVRRIARAVAPFCGTSPALIASGSQFAPEARARMITAAIARELMALSFPEIGRRIGRDHSTVLNAHRRFGPLVRACIRERT